MFNIPTYKIIAMCIEHATASWSAVMLVNKSIFIVIHDAV